MVQLFRSFQSPSFPMLALIRHRIYMNRTHGARVMNDWWGRWNESRVNKRRFAAVKDVSWGPYTSPEVYDIAFSYRDFESEVSFLMEAYSMHTQLPLQRYLDIGCGPARHAMLLAQAAGIECIGIDSSEEMIHYARQRAQEYGIAEHVRLMQGDMKSCQGFKEIITCGSVNLAVIMIGTLSHCLTNDHALQCLKNVAEVLHSQGILIVELAHPKNLFSGDFVNGSDFADAWEISEDGSVEFARSDAMVDAELQDEDLDSEQDDNLETNNMKRVLVEYGREGDEFDCSSQILTRTVGMSLFDPSGNLVSSNVSKVPQRQFTLQEINMLADASGFEVVATYGDLDVDIPLESEEAYRMVVVLQNK